MAQTTLSRYLSPIVSWWKWYKYQLDIFDRKHRLILWFNNVWIERYIHEIAMHINNILSLFSEYWPFYTYPFTIFGSCYVQKSCHTIGKWEVCLWYTFPVLQMMLLCSLRFHCSMVPFFGSFLCYLEDCNPKQKVGQLVKKRTKTLG